jgi:hypothetical protein
MGFLFPSRAVCRAQVARLRFAEECGAPANKSRWIDAGNSPYHKRSRSPPLGAESSSGSLDLLAESSGAAARCAKLLRLSYSVRIFDRVVKAFEILSVEAAFGH